MIFSCISPCKLNLFLYVTGKRPDGYHNLQTLFVILDYGDTLSFESRPQELELLTDFGFPKEQNLIFKAARALKEYCQVRAGIAISAQKLIPQGGGLGGGSSNAATVLLVLNRLWHCNLSPAELVTLGARLGADVPVFIGGHTAFAEGIGEILHPADWPLKWYVVCFPGCRVSTAELFAAPDLKKDSPVRSFRELCALPFENSFTLPAISRYPQIARVLTRLQGFGPAFMSGSGSCCFVSFDTQAPAAAAAAQLQEEGYACFCAPACAESPVLRALRDQGL